MIAPEGWPYVLTLLLAGMVATVVGFPWVGWPLVGGAAFCLYFFRNPPRECKASSEYLCSPADGRVVKVGRAAGADAELGFSTVVSVFMSPLDVHVNRAPASGRLVHYQWTPGRKVAAYREDASLVNERNIAIFEGNGARVGVRQVAGTLARRIVFDLKVGDEVERGERIGLIKFGSRVDLLLPEGVEPMVKEGDRVRAGESVVARFHALVYGDSE